MAPDQAAPVPAGWYPDPYGVSELRWWDAQNWTDSVHPPVAPPPPAAPPVPPQPVPVPAAQAAPVTQPAAEPVAPAQPVAEPVMPAQPVPSAEPVAAQLPPLQAPAVPAFMAPPATPPLVEPPVAELPAVSEAVDPALPSRRAMRTHSATTEGGPLSAVASAPAPAAVPDSAAPNAFDWLTTGGTSAPAAAQPPTPAAPVVTPAVPPLGSTGSVPVPATSAWAQESAPAAADPKDLYASTASRKSTASGWLIALMPLIAGILAIAVVKGAENYPRYLPFEWWMLVGGVVVILYLVTLILAVADRSKLDWAGYNRPAHWAWALLTAPVYLLVRTIVVKRETGRNSALLWVWLALAAVLVGAWFAVGYLAPELIAGYTLPFL